MRTAIVGLILICGLQIIKADDMKVLFLAPPDAKIKTNRQFAPAGGFGEVSISEVSLGKRFASDSSLEAVRQHAEYFDFYLVLIKFGVLGFDGKTCKWIQVGATLRSSEEDNGKIFILNIFPATSLKKGSIGTDGKLIISSDLKVAIPEAAPASGSVSVGGSANINWNWSSLYQEVAAIHDQSRAIWRFDAVGSEFPVGEVDVATIVAVAKSLSNPSTKIDLELEMRASFGGGWFDRGGLANTKATVLVKLP